jgi:hypothetical protein
MFNKAIDNCLFIRYNSHYDQNFCQQEKAIFLHLLTILF